MKKVGEKTEEGDLATSVYFTANDKITKKKSLIYYDDEKEQNVVLTNEGKVYNKVDSKLIEDR